MATYNIQGQPLEITVIGCTKLKDTEWISRQDPYVCLEYGSTKFRTTTCTDGGRNPTFQQKFVFSLIEGLREINVTVWNSNTVTYDDFIGNGKIQLAKVLAEGYDDSSWSLQTKTGRHAGEVRLILHFANTNRPQTSFPPPSAPPFQAPPQVSMYAPMPMPTPSPHPTAYPPTNATPPYAFSSPFPSYPPNVGAYQTSMYSSPYPAGYPPASYPPPPSAYPPSPYPPPPQASPFYPPGPYPGVYPPPQY